jgi:hypothetical protein
LDISGVEGERLILLSREARPAGVMRELARQFGERARQKGLLFDYQMRVEGGDSGRGVPVVVASDEKRLRQALANLLDNAVRYTEQGGVQLRLTWLDAAIRLEVSDTGPGLPDPETIFEPFREEVMGRTGGGLCLGLTATRRIVRLLGGELRLESARGKGSRFWFEIPVEVLQWQNGLDLGMNGGKPVWDDASLDNAEHPPSDLLDRLIESARGGRIAILLEEADRIQEASPGLAPFADRLRELSQGFRVKEVREWLNALRRGEREQSP